TLAIPPVTDFDAELKQLAADINPEAIFSLPAVKMFKLRAYFAMDEGSQAAVDSGIQSGEFVPQPFGLSESDRMIVNGLQQDLPLVPRPFDALAEQAGMILDDFLVHCRMLQQSGVIRRFGAAINHKRAGFKANAMTCWMAPPEIVDAAGEKLAALREVSHCYERQTNPLWHHNLFAMIHHDSAEGCRQIADRVAAETGLGDCIMLFSTREFKKVRVRYQV
ncbi:MAG: hypothetical protein U1B77_04680, partial [Dehalococcoidales bacterium]|nr:hypothetical protein [Dehalococcoidales bacterium]